MTKFKTKLKHLEFIQIVISRMNNCSFLLKGWSVSLVSALIALSTKDTDPKLIYVAYFPAIAFWILDGFFLDQERRYRKLYALVVRDTTIVSEFEMNTLKVPQISGSWTKALFSKTLMIFHGIVFGSISLAMIAIMLLE